MRILHLTRDYPPRCCGGISVAVPNLVDALRNAGACNAVVSFDAWRGRDSGVVRAERHDDGTALRVQEGAPFREIEELAGRFRPDVIHVHHENLVDFAIRVRERWCTPFAYTVHTLQRRDNTTSHDQRRSLAEADAIFAPSRAVAEIVEGGDYGRSNGKARLHVTPNVVAAAAPSQRCPAPAPTVIYVGRFDRAKGTDVLFDAMHIALRQHPNLRFEIAGGLPASSRRERKWRRQWTDAVTTAHADRVRFHGWLDRGELDRMLERAILQLVPSRFETFGLAAAEAMDREVPVIASRAAALMELIDDGRTGTLVDPGDAEALANATLEAVAQPEQLASLADAGRRSIRERCSPETVAASTVAALSELA